MIKKFNEILNEGKSKKYTEKEISDSVKNAEECFWNCIAEEFPAIKSGDLSPDATFALTNAMEKAVKEWLEMNE